MKGEWVQTFGAKVFGVVRADKRYLWLVHGCLEYHRLYLQTIPEIVVLKVGNHSPDTGSFWSGEISTDTSIYTLKSIWQHVHASLYTEINSLLTDTCIKRPPCWNGHIEMGSTFVYSLQLTLNKMDISIRSKHSAGPKGFHLFVCITKSIIKSMTQCNLHCLEFSLTNELLITANSRLADTPI